jgi:hypothetical protein
MFVYSGFFFGLLVSLMADSSHTDIGGCETKSTHAHGVRRHAAVPNVGGCLWAVDSAGRCDCALIAVLCLLLHTVYA